MAESAPEHARYRVARESEQESTAIAAAIGEYLQSQLSEVIREPLPEQIAALLSELRPRRDQRGRG